MATKSATTEASLVCEVWEPIKRPLFRPSSYGYQVFMPFSTSKYHSQRLQLVETLVLRAAKSYILKTLLSLVFRLPSEPSKDMLTFPR